MRRMCGRFVVAKAASELIAEFDVELEGEELPEPSYNIPPASRIPIILDAVPRGAGEGAEPARRLEAAKWGLVPSWAKDPSVGVRSFNARSETAASKPTFRSAVRQRRAMIPATGYYEWRRHADGSKTPHFIRPADGSTLPMAGLYEWWRDPEAGEDAPWLLSATILTRAAAGHLAEIHDRMPVFLDRGELAEWLDPRARDAEGLLATVAARGEEVAETLEAIVVGPEVGNVRAQGPSLIEPAEGR